MSFLQSKFSKSQSHIRRPSRSVNATLRYNQSVLDSSVELQTQSFLTPKLIKRIKTIRENETPPIFSVSSETSFNNLNIKIEPENVDDNDSMITTISSTPLELEDEEAKDQIEAREKEEKSEEVNCKAEPNSLIVVQPMKHDGCTEEKKLSFWSRVNWTFVAVAILFCFTIYLQLIITELEESMNNIRLAVHKSIIAKHENSENGGLVGLQYIWYVPMLNK